jgi:hypothetical protein
MSREADVDVDRKAIPTLYHDIQFRSRLEAKWAAFFDLMGWPYVYEPFDLEGWIPDFALTGGRGLKPILVEVKPVLTRDMPLEIMEKIDATSWEGGAIVLGCEMSRDMSGMPLVGWCNDIAAGYEELPEALLAADPGWDHLEIGVWELHSGLDSVKYAIGLSPVAGEWGNLIGHGDGSYKFDVDRIWKYVFRAWCHAGNVVQYRGALAEPHRQPPGMHRPPTTNVVNSWTLPKERNGNTTIWKPEMKGGSPYQNPT